MVKAEEIETQAVTVSVLKSLGVSYGRDLQHLQLTFPFPKHLLRLYVSLPPLLLPTRLPRGSGCERRRRPILNKSRQISHLITPDYV